MKLPCATSRFGLKIELSFPSKRSCNAAKVATVVLHVQSLVDGDCMGALSDPRNRNPKQSSLELERSLDFERSGSCDFHFHCPKGYSRRQLLC